MDDIEGRMRMVFCPVVAETCHRRKAVSHEDGYSVLQHDGQNNEHHHEILWIRSVVGGTVSTFGCRHWRSVAR